MQFLNKFFGSITQIKRFNSPECRNCKHFMPKKVDLEEYRYGKCSQLGEKDVVTGEINYKYASVSRIFSRECGEHGKYYSPKE